MYAIAFDMKTGVLEKEFSEPDNSLYSAINEKLNLLGFYRTVGNIYLTANEKDPLAKIYRAINELSKNEWFRNNVEKIHAFKIEDWSDFTEIVRNGKL